MRPETREAMEMLWGAKWNLPKAAEHCGLTNKEMKITYPFKVLSTLFTARAMANPTPITSGRVMKVKVRVKRRAFQKSIF